jgi:hypothetical protein
MGEAKVFQVPSMLKRGKEKGKGDDEGFMKYVRLVQRIEECP